MTASQDQEARLWDAFAARAGEYPPRTRHWAAPDRPRYINRLVLERSPYLLQHAHNPVNWYGWGDEAFAAAAATDKPLFLSVGYSTCHWCHVMEEESFDNPDIAELLNRHFISVKLDREQHPDIDEYYMTAVQFISGHGGWPMSNFLLPDGRPFYSATYFPPQQFAAVLNRIHELWLTQRPELEASAAKVGAAVADWLATSATSAEVDEVSASDQVLRLLAREDEEYAGLAGAPKFPQEPLLLQLLDTALRRRRLDAANFVLRALTAMAAGGIYDQVGGGFHRYSVDSQWLVPHFEKMLYNQSQLGLVLLQAWRVTDSPVFHRALGHTLDYVLREMQLPRGGFCSATDADSEGEEGRFFVWTWQQLTQALDEDEMQLLQDHFQISRTGNFEGANILSLRDPGFAGTASAATMRSVDKLLEKLRLIRTHRIPPLRDDKTITGWSAAMAETLLLAGWQLQRRDYVAAAERALDQLWQDSLHPVSGLQRLFLHGAASGQAQLEDHAQFCLALLARFDVTGDVIALQRARRVLDLMLERFWNPGTGGFFNSELQPTGPRLARSSQAADGATLSAIGLALLCLVRMAQRTAREDRELLSLRDRINRGIAAHGAQLTDNPAAHVTLLRAITEYRHGSREPIQFAAGGLVRVSARRREQTHSSQLSVDMELAISDGWRLAVTANPLAAPLQLALTDNEPAWEMAAMDILGGATGDGNLVGACRLQIVCRSRGLEDALSRSVGLALSLQLCNDSVCLGPERLEFRL